MSSADQTVLRYVKEVTMGVTPATPALSQIRFTGESLNYNIDNIQSDEIRPDRVQTDLIQVGANSGGNINFEMSFGSFTDFIAAALAGEWVPGTGDHTVLVNGATLTTFSIQKEFADMDVPQFHTYPGVSIDGWSFKAEVGSIVKGEFKVLGMGLSISESQIVGATFPTASSTEPMNAVTNFQDFSLDGVPYTGCIQSYDLEIKNNIRQIKCIGSIAPTNMKLGTLEVSGESNFYFNEGSVYDLFVNGTEFAQAFKMEDNDGNSYSITLPRCKFETGEVVAGGKNSDVMFKAKWRALYDATSGTVITIEADPA